MKGLAREVGWTLVLVAVVVIILGQIAQLFPEVQSLIAVMVVGLVMVAPGLGIGLRLLDSW